MKVTKVEAIRAFLIGSTHGDLAELYSQNMEVQILVGQDGGERINKTYKGHNWTAYTDGLQTWKPFRIPYMANSNPEFDLSSTMDFDLTKHAEGIGMTGWDWIERKSKWVAFDFDSITGHSEAHEKKLTQNELDNIREIVSNIPWITIRKSTGGNGLHLYVFLDPVPTANHTEHAALARAIIGKVVALTGYDFTSRVDVCGGNMWVWHRKMAGTDGLKLIKQGEVLSEIPPNWRDHLCVVTGRKKRSIPAFITDKGSSEIEEMYDQLSGQRAKIPLDESHKALIKYLDENGCYWSYDQDACMLIAHTHDLKTAHTSLNMRGVFDTIATGSEPGSDKNCFLYPIRNGGWSVRRYTPGVAEAPTWEQDGQGWTRCFFNVECDLKTAANSFGGREDTDGSYHFREAEMAVKALHMLGITVKYDNVFRTRPAKLKEHKDGKVLLSIEHRSDDILKEDMESWIKKKGFMSRLYKIKSVAVSEQDTGNYDEIVRHLSTEGGDNYGWMIKDPNGWRREPLDHVKIYLTTTGLAPKEVTGALGSCIANCWTVVNKPFCEEYPGNRQWNKYGAKLKFQPTIDLDNLNFPHWNSILSHCGAGLNAVVAEDPWCKANGVLAGADYLKCWIACLVQKPTEPLPYLFFYSFKQDTGKSIFHEALSLLIDRGVQRADTALTNKSGFNAEIENAVLCVVEETNLQIDRNAYNRIKDWVTARQLPIHRKGQTPYTILNTTHWVQCANDPTYCPILPGDTRITMICVEPFEDVTEMIPKEELLKLLEQEASDFLAEILNIELPKVTSRLSIPPLETDEKITAAKSNRSILQMFLDDECYRVEGSMVEYGELYERFKAWLDPNELHKWSKIRFGKELVNYFPKGRNPKNAQWCVGNLSFTKDTPKGIKLISRNDKLVPYENK